MVNAIKLKILGRRSDTGGEIHRYDFIINPLVQGSGIYRFMRYCKESDLHDPICRAIIARDVWTKHRQTWQRYHEWRETHNA